MNVQSGVTHKGISSMTMEEIVPMLCEDSFGEAYACIDCTSTCPFGKRAVELLEKETKGANKPMSKKQIADATRRVEAMENYLEVMSQPDPMEYLKAKYNITVDRTAKNKIYQWQHNYGTNLGMIANRVKELKDEIAASKPRNDVPAIEKLNAVIPPKTSSVPTEEKKLTKRQEDKISQSHLEQMRREYEAECLDLEKQIEDHKKAIVECEKKIEAIADRVKSIRAVLDIFKEKNSIYV